MILGLCESPLTFQAITIWREELLNEDILLRDVIDLETTFGESVEEEGENATAAGRAGTWCARRRRTGQGRKQELDADGNPITADDDDDEEEEAGQPVTGGDGSGAETPGAGHR